MAHLIKPQIALPEVRPFTYGGGGWPLELHKTENWAWFKGVFEPHELDSIIQLGIKTGLDKGSTMGGGDESIRNSFVSFLYPNEYTGWIFQRLADVINHVNGEYFKFDLTSMEQGLQFTSYTAPGEHYTWHIDKGTGNRKLSLSLQLSDPKDYKGGNLEMWFGGKPVKADRERGMMTFFPSYALHRVTPVTQGTRYSLVCWVSGPPFK